MSATLTWYNYGLGTKTGTAVANFFDDLDTLITSKSGDANFKWEKAGKNSGSTPYYLLLRRKDGSAGRIGIICWTSGPAANNIAILDTAPTTNQIYVAWFPSGTGTTMSNLTAASGTICGDDTNCVKVSAGYTIASAYPASFQHFVFENNEGMMFAQQNPASTTCNFFGAGDLLVDGSDVAYGCTIGGGSGSTQNFGSSSVGLFQFSNSNSNAGNTSPAIRTNYGAAGRTYYAAYMPSGAWASQAIGGNDVLTNTSTNDVWFVPYPLIGSGVKGGGMPLKLRQMGFGPTTTSQFVTYNTTGPVVAARQFYAYNNGGGGCMWMTNDKL